MIVQYRHFLPRVEFESSGDLTNDTNLLNTIIDRF